MLEVCWLSELPHLSVSHESCFFLSNRKQKKHIFRKEQKTLLIKVFLQSVQRAAVFLFLTVTTLSSKQKQKSPVSMCSFLLKQSKRGWGQMSFCSKNIKLSICDLLVSMQQFISQQCLFLNKFDFCKIYSIFVDLVHALQWTRKGSIRMCNSINFSRPKKQTSNKKVQSSETEGDTTAPPTRGFFFSFVRVDKVESNLHNIN